MYHVLLVSHSWVRWLVLASLVFAISRAYNGYTSKSTFSRTDNGIRHWTATIAHIQLVIGILLYFQSPLIKYIMASLKGNLQQFELAFFGLIHGSLMLAAIVVVTIGSAKSKREQIDTHKFKTMLVWYAIALGIMLIAIPWPFSPLATRPYLR
ncbi:hypothetical protein EXU57_11730 [Segetibacter sp. 3557_3]|uniref:hypothetical protein n=1 Tax=Segetibacter sp. 3557_3 TaxID=2547429 RepID=UPI001058E56D|nr:hypothetical protein [Segetibacter sp. 3557_3]TDH26155.1 hypothetical protein EXU57_11730 [Segetibacter sp. 3557_3]